MRPHPVSWMPMWIQTACFELEETEQCSAEREDEDESHAHQDSVCFGVGGYEVKVLIDDCS